MKRMILFISLYIMPFIFLFCSSYVSANPVLTIESGACAACQNNNELVGWSFDVLDPVLVTGLGWYSSNGIHWHHNISLYDPYGAELATAYIPDSTSVGTYLDGQFVTADVTPVLLSPGSGYRIEGDNYFDSIEILAYNPRLSWVDPRISFLGSGIFGPSFSVAPSSVPLPSAIWLFGAGVISLFGIMRRSIQAIRRKLA